MLLKRTVFDAFGLVDNHYLTRRRISWAVLIFSILHKSSYAPPKLNIYIVCATYKEMFMLLSVPNSSGLSEIKSTT